MKANRMSNSVQVPPKFPAVCEPELQKLCADWGPKHRREIAEIWERWAAQLRFSADLIEQMENPGAAAAVPDWVAAELENLRVGKAALENLLRLKFKAAGIVWPAVPPSPTVAGKN